ncbi:MAG: TonB-dependent receptor [Niabella sp.]|nr:TonB-dependent receptor [Niabella sp.]
MKFSVLFLFVACLQVAGKSYSQKITLSLANVPIKTIFKEIERQSGYQFLYKDNLLRQSKNVSITLNGVSIQEAMDKCLFHQPLTYAIVDKIIVIKGKKEADKISEPVLPAAPPPVKGVVKNENGMPLSGVSVMISGTQKGVTTNANGEFLINAREGDVLEFSIVGYMKKNVTISRNLYVTVQLEINAAVGEDVIIVGYGTQRQVNVTGAVTQVDAKTLQDRPITRLSQGLQGLVGNLNISNTSSGGAPDATQSFNIRGYTGLGTTGTPLIVIDGVQGGDINTINPNDVESITVIKDAAASAVYGSSAPYGVLLIKTKQGRKGRKPAISYNNNLNFAQPIGLPRMLNSVDYATIFNEARKNAGGSAYYSDATIQRMRDYQAGNLETETIKDPNNDVWLGVGGANANNDWFKIYFKNVAFSQQHNLSLNGATDNASYYVGLGYTGRDGMYRYGNDFYKRYNIRTNLSTKINNWLSFNFRGAFSKEISNTPNTYSTRTGGNYMHQIGRKHPEVPLYNPDGGFSDASDILLMNNGGRNMNTTDKPVLTGEFVAKLAKGWNATVNYTYDGAYTDQTSHIKTVNTTLPSGATAPVSGTYPNSFTRLSRKYQKDIINLFTSYSTKFNRHDLKLTGGFVQELTSATIFKGSNSSLFSDNIPSLALTYGTTPSVTDAATELAVQGYFGRLNYAYDDRYLVELVGRYDGTSRFLKDVRWRVYPGLSAGWNVNKEKFWKAGIEKYISALKLRGSYGSLGDQSGLSEYAFYPDLGAIIPSASNWLFGTGREVYVTPPDLVDPSLTWVTAITLDLGVDAVFLKNRLTATFDWYKRKMDNFIGPSLILPAVMGVSAPPTNSAAMETTGFELTLGWKDRVGELKYDVRAILSDYKGKVTRYPNPTLLLSNNWYEGASIGNIWGYVTDRYFNDGDDFTIVNQMGITTNWTPGDIKYRDLNGDGKVDQGKNTLTDPGDMIIIGNTTPRYSYSFLGNLGWKNFDFSIFIQGIGRRHNFITEGDFPNNLFFGIVGNEFQASLFTQHLDRWTPETPNGYFPKYYMGGANPKKNLAIQTKYLLNTAYMRLKNIQLGYALPQAMLSKANIQKVRVFMSAENLATFSKALKHSSLDPELNFSQGKIYPLQRNYSFGINLTF